MKLPSLKTFIKIELILALIAVVLYLNTRDANDFSGLVIIFPIFGMAFTSVIALVVFIIKVFSGTSEKQTTKSKLLRFGALVVFGIPVYAVFSSGLAAKPFYSQVLLIFLAALSVYIFVNDKLGAWRKPYELILLAFAPILSVIYALDTDTSTMPYFWLALGFGIFAIGCAKIIHQR